MNETKYKEENLPDLLPLYYKRIFPIDLFFKWLTYCSPSTFVNREISFTLLGDIYIRYQSFRTQEEFAQALHKKYPIKIDIGAIYNTNPQTRGSLGILIPKEKEIVFDIDMTDYDEIRTCCSGTDVCVRCWKFMVIACRILDISLREDFGFNHLLWVFSGRRGVHCWVSDERARKCNESMRQGIAEYLQLIRGTVNSKRITLGWKLHPLVTRAISIIDKYFNILLREQKFFETPEQLVTLLKFVPSNHKETFLQALEKVQSSEDRWSAFQQTFEYLLHKGQIPREFTFVREEIKLFYAYPRLDINVTKGFNHLLKAPFCVHPKSGKICVPFNPKLVDNFDPDHVPTLSLVIDEINLYDAKTKEQENKLQENVSSNLTPVKIKDNKKTSLLKSLNVFNEFLRGLEKNDGKTAEKMDF